MPKTVVPRAELETRRRRLDSDTPVSRLMTTSAEALALDVGSARAWAIDAHAIDALTTVREATHLMVERGLRQIQVRNQQGEIVGVLAASDLYRWVTDAGDERDAALA
jgi:predicted transcriptional regulator